MSLTITPQMWQVIWKLLPHAFTVNIWTFEVKAGQTATDVFKDSFAIRRFNSQGSSPWPIGIKRNKGGRIAGGLIESGSLRESIKYKMLGQSGEGETGVLIYTDPNAFGGTFSHRGFCYAAVHNAAPGDREHKYGHMKGFTQRKFMGYSTVLNKELRELEVEIFKGFPK